MYRLARVTRFTVSNSAKISLEDTYFMMKSKIEDSKIKKFEIKDRRLSQIVYFKFCQIVIKNAKNHKIEPFGLKLDF